MSGEQLHSIPVLIKNEYYTKIIEQRLILRICIGIGGVAWCVKYSLYRFVNFGFSFSKFAEPKICEEFSHRYRRRLKLITSCLRKICCCNHDTRNLNILIFLDLCQEIVSEIWKKAISNLLHKNVEFLRMFSFSFFISADSLVTKIWDVIFLRLCLLLRQRRHFFLHQKPKFN